MKQFGVVILGVAFFALAGCEGYDSESADQQVPGVSTVEQSDNIGGEFAEALQGSWSCDDGEGTGADINLFMNTPWHMPYITRGTRIDVTGEEWRVTTSDFIGGGTFEQSGSTMTIETQGLEQRIEGVPTSMEEATGEKMILVEGADPQLRLRFAMLSPTEIKFEDSENEQTFCYKY